MIDLAPPRGPLPLVRPGWPGAAAPLENGPAAPRRSEPADIARQFETLIARTLLQSARAAKLGDDGLGASGDSVRDMADQVRAEAIARAAPLGVARLLARENRRTDSK